MNTTEIKELDIQSHVWRQFVKDEKLTAEQADQFARYYKELLTWNEDMNITAIVKPENVVAYHFQDSLYLDRFVDFSKIESIADIGSGGGFPGIPLKIKYPHLKVVLIEVNRKKRTFLEHVVTTLGLSDVDVCELDWRTFLRKWHDTVDLFVSRASLHPDELMRMFKPGCQYKASQLVYWASKEWEIRVPEELYFIKDEQYVIKNKKRRYIFFALTQ